MNEKQWIEYLDKLEPILLTLGDSSEDRLSNKKNQFANLNNVYINKIFCNVCLDYKNLEWFCITILNRQNGDFIFHIQNPKANYLIERQKRKQKFYSNVPEPNSDL